MKKLLILLLAAAELAAGGTCAHDWKDATCTEPKTCAVCGQTEGEALGHDWEEATLRTPKTCKVCGATEGDTLASEITCDDLTSPYHPGKPKMWKKATVVDGKLEPAKYNSIMFRPCLKGGTGGIYFKIVPTDDLVVKIDGQETTDFTYTYGNLVLNQSLIDSLDKGIRILEVYSTGGNFWDAFVVMDIDDLEAHIADVTDGQ